MSNGEVGDKTIRQEICYLIALRIAGRKDAVISSAISNHLGHEDWTLDMLGMQLSSYTVGSKELWEMDGTVIAEFTPGEVALQDGFIGAQINYRILV